MPDVKVRNRKTGAIEIQPERVAQLLKNVYTIIGPADADEIKPPPAPIQKKVEDAAVNELSDAINPPQVPDDNIDGLRLKYESLYGERPHGRTSAETLRKKISEKENA